MESFNWEGLPVKVRIEVASLLDVRERLPLQLTSKSNSTLVSYCPIHLDTLTIQPQYPSILNEPLRIYQVANFKNSKNIGYTQKTIFDIENSPQQFLKYSKNTRIKKLKLINSSVLKPFFGEVQALIKKEKEMNNKSIKFRVKGVEWRGKYQNMREYVGFTEFLQYFDANVLECIKIDTYKMPLDVVKELMAAENLRTVPLALRLYVVPAEYAVEMIKNFRTTSRPDHTFFSLSSVQPLGLEIKQNIFDLLELPINSRESISSDPHNHVLNLSCLDPRSSFLLKIDSHSIFGTIVSKEFVKSLKMDVSVFMNLKEYGFDWKNC